jgi:hypothetical protein
MKKILILCMTLLFFPISISKTEEVNLCLPLVEMSELLKDTFNELPVILWKIDEHLSGVMFYNAKTKTATFLVVFRNESIILSCVASAGTITHLNLDGFKSSIDL